jgi:hypothetical protein
MDQRTELPPWAARLLEEVDGTDLQAKEVARALTEAQLNWRAAPDSWSIGQCLLHLLVANDVYLAPIARALDHRTPSPVEAITPGWFGRWFIRTAIEPSTQKRRGKAPRKIAPPQHASGDVVDRFVRSNVALREMIRRAGPYDVNRIRFQNPFVPIIFFTVGTGLEIVVRHQRRHLLQAERVRKAPGFPK